MTHDDFVPIRELDFGFADAENYRRRENKDLFNRIFFRTESLDELCHPGKFFLLGEKGTGKTAYAVYFSNNAYRDHFALHRYIRETEYDKFLSMKRSHNLSLSDYASIWKVILYLLLAEFLVDRQKEMKLLTRFTKLASLKKAIDEYYTNAFSPEILQALQFIERSDISAGLIAKYASLESHDETRAEFSSSRLQTNLLFIQKKFEDAFASLKLEYTYLLFIDGIDIRPTSIPYHEYLECIRGLANAVWSVNNDFFPSIKDSKGRMRTIMLARPDIFNSLGLQNRNTKIRDNSTLLDWRTTYNEYRTSPLFEVSDRMLRVQQSDDLARGEAWDHYFPFDAATVHSRQPRPSSFVVFLRYSFHRPCDIVTMLDLLKVVHTEEEEDQQEVFSYSELMSPGFRNAYSNYLLGEVRDQLVFYYTDEDFEIFLRFFQFLHGRTKFSYEEYLEAFSEFNNQLSEESIPRPDFAGSADEFLQFLYELNVISFKEEADDENFIRWCFRERSAANISPKVKTGASYEIHYGLRNALNTGKPLRSSSEEYRRRGSGEAAQRVVEVVKDVKVKHRGEVVHVEPRRGLLVLRLEWRGRRLRAPRSVLEGIGRNIMRRGRVADVICVQDAAQRIRIDEIRIDGFVWSAGSEKWDSA